MCTTRVEGQDMDAVSAFFNIGGTRHRRGQRTLVMGILNVTPDSFSDGGHFDAVEAAVTHAYEMARDGADIIDIGGESTRPGSSAVDAEEEFRRVAPVIERLVGDLERPISIDTYKAEVAARAAALGAVIINDIWGLQGDPEMAGVVAETGAALVAMHNRHAIEADIDIRDDVRRFFDKTLALAEAAGIASHRIILDPGIGFGKTAAQNVEMLSHLDDLDTFGLPILVGTSRKSMFGKLLDLPVDRRLNATIASNVLAIAKGADIVRVHDVREHVEACRFTDLVVRGLDG